MQSNLETILGQLVAIPSVSKNTAACREALEYVHMQIAPHHLFISSDMERDSPWLIATTKDTQEPDILFACHLDVVPAGAGMFTMKKAGDKLFGRGVYDMKFAASVYLQFIHMQTHKLSELNIGFLFTTDEEIGGFSVPAILELGWRPKVVFIPDGGYNWQLEELAKGLYGVELVAKGQAAHGSRPWEGDNALHRIIDAVNELRRLFPHQHPDTATLSVNQINGGAAINQIADFASVKIDFRSFHKEDLALFYAEVVQVCTTFDLELTITQEGSPHVFDKNSSVAQRFLPILEGITGKATEYTQSFGGTDARHFAEYNIPCVIISPHGDGHHGAEEWVRASDLPRYYKLVETWALDSLHP